MRILNDFIKNKRGISFIIVLTIGVVVIFILLAVLPQGLNERQIAERQADSIRAFYAAESGINSALWALNNYSTEDDWTEKGWDISDPNLYKLSLQDLEHVDNEGNPTIIAQYEIDMNRSDPENPIVDSTGYSPEQGDAERSIRALVRKTGSNIDSAIEASGDITIGGNAKIKGTISPNSDFSFKDIFGMSIEEMKTNPIVDPNPNYTPVSGVTFFELVDKSEVRMSAGSWSGSGIMVVEGNLKITGGEFSGIIWTTGDFELAGNAEVEGAVFVEGDASILIGTPELEYDQDDIQDALDGANLPDYFIYSWKES